MTEYDFSPEAYQHHLANMHRIGKWVDTTEQHRPQFTDAAALTEGQRRGRGRRLRRSSFGHRREPPPPLALPPHGHPQGVEFGYSAMHAYPSPPHSSASFDMDFAYAKGPGSPGPMAGHPQMYMYPGLQPHSPFGFVTPPPSPHRPSHYHRHSSRSRHGHSRSSSQSFLSQPMFYPYMGGGNGQQYGQSYVMASPPHHMGGQVSYMYV
ncbi:hypothetical protein Hypma_004430 [Hypsizygus marmoreus]|uniref:Uncharacterized protein n=1 Tax=Hypsizygus marmoreus TaxID=39966 RepID=A0A369K361_HYPMA|nr:hypothetical protein Hypma_004430 [Hypsizygus marmoreus]